MGAFATMSSKGQLTIPKEVRDELGLSAGTRFYVTTHEGNIVAMPRNLKLADLAGMLGRAPNGRSMTIDEMNDAIGKAVADDDRRIAREWHEDEA